MTTALQEKKWFELIKRYQRFLITAHMNPDPDAICSELAMAKFLKAHGKQVIILNSDGFPERLRFLPGAGQIQKFAAHKSVAFDVAVILDSGDVKRTGRVAELLTPDKILVNIDHHVTSHFFGAVNIIDPKASSTAEVIFRLLKIQKEPIDRAMATLLYLGIMTDTGSFRYENTSAYTHQVVAELVALGVSPADLYKRVYETVPFLDFKYFSKIVSQFEIFADGRVIGMQLPRRIVRRFSEEFDLRDKIFRELRTIKGVEVVFILTEDGPRSTKVNLRSHGPVDVSQLAASFGGGGHRKASGCHIARPLSWAKREVLAKIRKLL